MKMQDVVSVVDYEMGNVGSVLNMLKYIGYRGCIVSNGRELANAENIILLGVGYYKKQWQILGRKKLIRFLKKQFMKEMLIFWEFVLVCSF